MAVLPCCRNDGYSGFRGLALNQFGQRFQMWFSSLPLWGRAVVVSVLALVAGGLTFGNRSGLELEDVVRFLPLIGAALALGGVGGFLGWKWLERRRFEKQMALNEELARHGVVRLTLPPRGGKDVSWKKIADQAESFATFVAAALRQFPDMHIALEIVGAAEGTLIEVWTPEEVMPTIIQGLLSAFSEPEVQIRQPKMVLKGVDDPLANLDPGTQWAVLGLAQKASYPLKQANEFSADSLASVLAALVRSPGMGRVGVQFILKAPDERWNVSAQRSLQQMRLAMAQQRSTLRASGDRQRLAALEQKADALTGVAVTTVVFAEPKSADRISRVVMAIVGSTRSPYNTLRVVAQGQGAKRVCGRHFDYRVGKSTILSAEEMASLWHIPRAGTGDVVLARGVYIPPPPQVVTIERPPFRPDRRILGKGITKTGDEVFIFWEHGFDTLVHSFICGPTGAGKSTLIALLAVQDICAGYGGILMEPHRDLTLAIIDSVPASRSGDVIWINPTNPHRSFGINLMDCSDENRDAAASAFSAALQKIVGGEWERAVQMKRLLSNAVLALVEGEERATMLHLMAFFRHEDYRARVLERVENPVVRDFWEVDFNTAWAKADKTEATKPVFNRVEPLLSRPMMRHVVSQSRTTLPMRQMIDAGKVILIDLSARDPRIGKDNAEALGTLVVALVWSTAAARVKHTFRLPMYFWIDEFQNYVTPEFVEILAEARGFGLGVNMATQYYERLPDWMRQAVLSNCRTKVTSGVESPDEARLMTRIFGRNEDEVRSMDAYTYLARVCSGRSASDTFTLIGFPPLGKEKNRIDPDRLYRAMVMANGGKPPLPADHGGVPFDFFDGVAPMDGGERSVWEKHQQAMRGLGVKERAEYLAGLDEGAWEEYRRLRRQADYEEYRELLDKPDLVPDTGEVPDDGAPISGKARRIRRLSSLQVEVPRDEIEAERLRLQATIQQASEWLDGIAF